MAAAAARVAATEGSSIGGGAGRPDMERRLSMIFQLRYAPFALSSFMPFGRLAFGFWGVCGFAVVGPLALVSLDCSSAVVVARSLKLPVAVVFISADVFACSATTVGLVAKDAPIFTASFKVLLSEAPSSPICSFSFFFFDFFSEAAFAAFFFVSPPTLSLFRFFGGSGRTVPGGSQNIGTLSFKLSTHASQSHCTQ